MKIFKQISPLKAYLKDVRKAGESVGLVPTMGALHRGHIALIEAAKKENRVTVCSIFVNPTQFNNNADLLHYPRTLESDTAMLQQASCSALFCPDVEEIYPQKSTLTLDFGPLDKVMEGRFRPGHFSGVGLVVSKLFHIIQPDHAYFGQKDWQQFAVIRKLVHELNFDVTLRSVPTLREADGLALSSRNLRLNDAARGQATIFYRALRQAKEALLGGKDPAQVRSMVSDMFSQYPAVRLEYFEIADSTNLTLVENVDKANRPILCIAGFVGEIRLIDNLFVFDE